MKKLDQLRKKVLEAVEEFNKAKNEKNAAASRCIKAERKYFEAYNEWAECNANQPTD